MSYILVADCSPETVYDEGACDLQRGQPKKRL